ncbi:MAG: hypothetical protein FJ197_12210 [Gammaproteobacteria bacterium]|nr:hypothetical protein [Gammaproteobacteria bacterium]
MAVPLAPFDQAAPTLGVAGPYSDPDGDEFAGSDWEIARDSAFNLVLLRRSLPDTNSVSLAPGIMDAGRRYFARTRHRDARGALSDWSAIATIDMAQVLAGDGDGDGVQDSSEAPGGSDSNKNGTPDAAEGICDLLTTGGDLLGLQSTLGSLQCFGVIATGEAPDLPSSALAMPYGLVSFRVSGLRVDEAMPATVTLQVHVPDRLTATTSWYKLDPSTGRLFEFEPRVSFAGNTALIEFEDGGPGDYDGVVNGTIIGPGGLVTVAGAAGGQGGNDDPHRRSTSSMDPVGLIAMLALAVARRHAGHRVNRHQAS